MTEPGRPRSGGYERGTRAPGYYGQPGRPTRPGPSRAPEDYGSPRPPEDYGSPRPPEDYGSPRPPEDYGRPRRPEDYGRPRRPEDYGRPRGPEDYERSRGPENLRRPRGPENYGRPRAPENYGRPRGPEDFGGPRRPENFRRPRGPEDYDQTEVFGSPGGPGGGPGRPGGPGGPGGGPGRPGVPGRRRKQPRSRVRRRQRLRRFFSNRIVRVALVLLALFMSWVTWSVGQTLAAPGNTGNLARVAEWMRDHYLGPVITLGEWIMYTPPKVGGKPQFSLAAPKTVPSKVPLGKIKPIVPARLKSPAGAPLPGEGQWRVLASVKGVPAIYGTYLRPDAIHTSYVAGIASMDQRLLKFQLRPGSEDPGPGNWGTPPWIPPGTRRGLLATFNGGFKIAAAGGGFYLNGVSKGALVQGAASLVFYKNGRVTVGQWGQGLHMTSQVVGVRQNLKLIVDHGVIPASVNKNVQSQWGATLGGAYYEWRSGIGITKDGRVVYAYGPALSVHSLAGLLQRAGVVEGMQLDINPAWMSYMYYKPAPDVNNPTPVNLLPDQPEPANRYYSINSRDFTAVYSR